MNRVGDNISICTDIIHLRERATSRITCHKTSKKEINNQKKSLVRRSTMSNGRPSSKRQRPAWKDSPAFLDAAASISATTFGARRLPELKALYANLPLEVLNDKDENKSGGGKTSSRHLRRRATSHLSRRKHRYPRGDFDNSVGKKAKGTKGDDTKKPPCRRARRKPALLKLSHELWKEGNEDAGTIDSEQVRWMMTHLWHAKRFHMHSVWGWKVPLMHINRGARASLRLVHQHTLVQDVTWAGQPLVVSCLHLEPFLKALHRVCPQLLQLPRKENSALSILCGNTQGYGVLYEPDQFPRGAIGPASWWVTRNSLDKSLDDVRSRWYHFHFWVHPSVKDKAKEILESVISATAGGEGPKELSLARIQIRGKQATNVIRACISPNGISNERQAYSYDWEKLQIDDAHLHLPHGTIIGVEANLQSNEASQHSLKDDCESYIMEIQNREKLWKPTDHEYTLRSIEAKNALLVSQCPRDGALPQNEAVCGWDILCRPDMAAEVFLKITNEGKACAIGLVDEAQAFMECEPPLRIFPRDFPDTKEGEKYWSQDSNGCWSLIRLCLEGGKGRISIPNAIEDQKTIIHNTINWNSLVAEDNNEDDGEVVVVRGAFGQPFLDSLSDSCFISLHGGKADKNSKNRRPRRRIRTPSQSIPTLPLSPEGRLAYCKKVDTLLQSLSLPALLQCHILLEGRGTILPGAHIIGLPVATNEVTSITYLGFAIAGDFSPGRGRCHGVGFIGAKRLLQILCNEDNHSNIVAITQPRSKKKQVALRVLISDADKTKSSIERLATLTLQL